MRTVSKYFIVLHIGSSDACIAFLSPFFCSVYFAIDYVLVYSLVCFVALWPFYCISFFFVPSFLRSSFKTCLFISFTVFFFLSVPLGSPVNISAQSTSSTSIKISWKPVSENLRLGIISKYVFNITNLLTGDLRTIEFDGSSLSGEVKNLSKFQEYSIHGAAVNSKGQSNFTSAITCRTSEDSKSASLFRIYFKEPYPLGD